MLIMDPQHTPMKMKQVVRALTEDKMQDNGLGREASCRVFEEGKGPRRPHVQDSLGAKLPVHTLQLNNPIGFLSKEIQGDGKHSIVKIIYF